MSPATTADLSPEALLQKASRAKDSTQRAKYATVGLSQPGLDSTTQAMLLRQLYLAHMEAARFQDALLVAEQMTGLDVLPDVARQDLARAYLAVGDITAAVGQLRLAARQGPPSRRAFHAWTLGSSLLHCGRYEEAARSLARATVWGTREKPLYRAQLALALRAAGQPHEALDVLKEQLLEAPCGQGYGQYVLGELSHLLGEDEEAAEFLHKFVQKTTGGRVALEVSLRAELGRAAEILGEISGG